jgi:glycine amidinotransferase
MWCASKWLSINNVSLDTERMIVEAQEEPLIKFLETIGVKAIKVPFRHVFSLGGGFHCHTCDIRRRGDLQSYF